MTISDRLDEIEARAESGVWTCAHCGRAGAAHAEGFASGDCLWEPLWVPAGADVIATVSALRKVLAACDELEANIPYDSGNETANRAGRLIRAEIAAALDNN
jgi:hypothetical protein